MPGAPSRHWLDGVHHVGLVYGVLAEAVAR